MKHRLLININAFCLLLDSTVQQYYQPSVSQFQYNPYQNVQNFQPQYSNQNGYNKWNIQGHKYEYDDDDSKECSCDDCVNQKSLCQNVCLNCYPQQPVMPHMTSNYFYFHYPNPYIIMPKESTTTEKTTTTSAATTQLYIPEIEANITTEDEEGSLLPKYIRMKGNIPYKLTVLKRAKHNKKPKNRKASTSEQFVEKLIPQMRNVEALHPRTSYLRNVNDIALYHS